MNKKVEKIRDDLYVKKVRFGHKVVYPIKKEDGSFNSKNFRTLIIRDILDMIPTLIIVAVLLMMLLPGAQNIKEQCEIAITDCYDNSCDICTKQGTGNDYIIPGLNLTIPNKEGGG